MKTRTVKNNGFNPVWNEKFDFPLRCSAVAHILIWCAFHSPYVAPRHHPSPNRPSPSPSSVEDEGLTASEHIGHYSLPVETIRPGYRVFPLYDKNNREVPLANLVCKFVFKDDSDLKLEAQVRECVAPLPPPSSRSVKSI